MFFRKKFGEIMVAMEIGSHKMVVAVGELQEDRSLRILGIGEVPSAGVRKGEVVEFHHAAQAVNDALLIAQEQSNCTIREVYLAIAGQHCFSKNIKVSVAVDEDDGEISITHLRALKKRVDNEPVKAGYKIIHAIHQAYYLDNQMLSTDPIGCHSSSLTGAYHLVYGMETKLINQVRILREIGLNCCGLLASGFASAQAVLSREQKDLGAVVIDLGAGTTDFCVYSNQQVVLTGSLGVGGDHLTHDLCFGLKIPFRKAEELKKNHGSVNLASVSKDARVHLERDMSFEGKSFYLESVVQILGARQEEILRLVRDELDEKGLLSDLAHGVVLTGGASRIKGLRELAEKVFCPCPVRMVQSVTGARELRNRAEYSTVLGLLRFAQNQEIRGSKGPLRRLIDPIAGLLTSVRLI